MLQKIVRRTTYFIVIFTLLATLLLQTDYVKNKAVNYVISKIEQKTGWQVSIGDISVYLPIQLTINDLHIKQDERPLINARHTDLAIIPFDFLLGKFIFHTLQINGLEIINLPALPPLEAEQQEKYIFKINDLEINELVIAPHLIERWNLQHYSSLLSPESPLTITGNVEIHPNNVCINGKLGLILDRDPKTESSLSFKCGQENGHFKGKFDVMAVTNGALFYPLDLKIGAKVTALGELSLSDSILTGTVTANYSEQNNLINLRTAYRYSKEDFITLSQLSGNVGPVDLEGSVHLLPNLTLKDTKFAFSIAEIDQLKKWVHYPIEGIVTGDFQLSGPIHDPIVKLNAIAPTVVIDDYLINDAAIGIVTRAVSHQNRGEVSLSFLKNKTPFNSTAYIELLEGGLISLEKLKINLPKAKFWGDLTFNLVNRTVQGEVRGKIDELKEYEEIWNLPLTGALRFNSIFTYEDEKGQTANLSIMGIDIAHQHYKAEKGSAEITLNHLESTPTGEFNISLENVGSKSYYFDTVFFSSHFDPHQNSWPFELEILGKDPNQASIFSTGNWDFQKNALILTLNSLHGKAATLPFDLTAPFHISVSPENIVSDPLKLKVDQGSISAKIEKLGTDLKAFAALKNAPVSHLQLFYPNFQATGEVSGHVNVQADLNVPLENAEIAGEASLTNGWYEGPNIGITLGDIQGKVVIQGKKITLTEISANDRSKGVITGHGELFIKEMEYPYQLNLHVKNTGFVNLDQVSAKMSGNIIIKGDIQGAEMSGELVSDTLKITLPENTKEVVQSINAKFINIPGDSHHIKENTKSTKSWPLALDLTLKVPEATVDGRGLRSTWAGEADIKGFTENPLVYGSFSIREGTYKFQGKIFELNQGTLMVDGEPSKKTTIYIIGEIDIDRMRIEAILRGALKDPALSFRSNPAMSQREILSWILFNRGLSELTSFQGTELNQSITNLITGDPGMDLLTKIRSKLGIDRIDICNEESSEGNAVSIRVGKYIFKDTYVSIGKNGLIDANTAKLEMNLFREFKLQGEIPLEEFGRKNKQLNLIWRRDY